MEGGGVEGVVWGGLEFRVEIGNGGKGRGSLRKGLIRNEKRTNLIVKVAN